jgi:hypothetical protein
VTTTIASDGHWPVGNRDTAGREPGIIGQSKSVGRRSLPRKVLGLLDDVVLALLIVLLFPFVILLVGTPVALVVRLLVEIAKRLQGIPFAG